MRHRSSDPDRSATDKLADALQSLQHHAEQQCWRGVAVVQAASDVHFSWPTHAVVVNPAEHQYRHYLGTNTSLLVLDLRSSLHGDAIAACLPTVIGGGIAVLLLPLTLTPFAKRLVAALPELLGQHLHFPLSASTGKAAEAPSAIDLSHLCLPTKPTSQVVEASQLNSEQRGVLEAIHQHLLDAVAAPVLINAARGRGKSTVLGVLAAQLQEHGYSVVVSAPSKRQLESLNRSAGQSLTYLPPDALVAEPIQTDILILDEAASLPQHMLDRLVERYPSIIMATTSEGYETCGRGFLLRFQRRLAQQFQQFLTCTLHAPVRFAPHCPTEAWLHQALLLNPTAENSFTPNTKASEPACASSVHYTHVHATELNEAQLRECFHLLMDAHYQTSPNDLKLLLDDPNHQLVIQHSTRRQSKELTAVAWLCYEGGLSDAMANAVVQGTRRPAGNLLAQSLAYYFQFAAAARARWLRITRVAVHPQLQNQGLGRHLITHILASAPADIDGIGTSFASTPAINRFWRRHQFVPVRLGARRDPTTGCHALIMLYPLRDPWRSHARHWSQAWHQEMDAMQRLYALPAELFSALQPLPEVEAGVYQAWAHQRLSAFAQGHLDISLVRPTMVTALASYFVDDELLAQVALDKPLTNAFKQRYQLSGRKEAVRRAREICFKLLRTI